MGSIVYNEGETSQLAVYFQNAAIPGAFYIGLGTGGAAIKENLTLSDIVSDEITGIGYVRQAVSRDASGNGWQVQGDTAVSREVLFTNTGIKCWEPVDFAFLTFSPSGLTPPTTLIASVDFKNTVLVKPGDTLRLRFKFRNITTYTAWQRIQCGQGDALASAASVTADPDVIWSVTSSIPGTATAQGDGEIS